MLFLRKKLQNVLLSSKNGLLLHPLSERAMAPTAERKGSEKFLKKTFQKVLEIPKNDLPLHPLSERAMAPMDERKGSEKFLKKKLFESFGGSKNMIYLCTTFRSEKRTEQNKTRIVLYSNIGTAFFEVIEQLNSFSTLFGE